MKIVKAVIQVAGPQIMPAVPMSTEDIRGWYRKVCELFEHQVLSLILRSIHF